MLELYKLIPFIITLPLGVLALKANLEPLASISLLLMSIITINASD